jgi:hypothetical protein
MVAAGKGKIPAGAYSAMTDYPEDVYTEPSDVDVHTLRNRWKSCRSLYQAKITERRARGPPNFVALPRNSLRTPRPYLHPILLACTKRRPEDGL